MPRPDQSSVSDERVAWFESMEYAIGVFTSELAELEQSLRDGDRRDAGLTIADVGFLLLYLRGWRESGELIIELAKKCEKLSDEIWREENSAVDRTFYERRAAEYETKADHMRELADRVPTALSRN